MSYEKVADVFMKYDKVGMCLCWGGGEGVSMVGGCRQREFIQPMHQPSKVFWGGGDMWAMVLVLVVGVC